MWLPLVNAPKHAKATPGAQSHGRPGLGRCPQAHHSRLLPARPWGTWHSFLLGLPATTASPESPHEEGGRPEGAAGARGLWHTLPQISISGQATRGKAPSCFHLGQSSQGGVLAAPTQLLPFLAGSGLTSSLPGLGPLAHCRPATWHEWGPTHLPGGTKGLQQAQGLTPAC